VERIRTFRTTLAPVFDQQGKVIRLVGSSEDVTEQKQAEKIIMERTREQAINDERGRLARDLHDAVTQTLFSTTLTAEVLPKIWEKNPQAGQKKLAELRELTRGALAEMRTLLLELRPDALADAKLEDLLQHLTNAFIARIRVPIQLQVEGACELPLDVKIAFYRIAQEALNNIAKHADPDLITVSLHCQPAQIELAIKDDGQGFDPDQMIGTDHYGLLIMRERAEEAGASLEINSQINRGTSILLTWRVDPASDSNPIDEDL
jgi:signal transduction histidine kinase